jgi:predicted nuclease of predicted toxin-antitoxin system
MSLSIVVDMNLSVEWVPLLEQAGWPTRHWSQVGDPRADDTVIMDLARTNGRAVFTHDLDFTTILALTHATGPSVIQVRGQNVLPEHLGPAVVAAIRQYESDLENGALIVVDVARSRVRILPL